MNRWLKLLFALLVAATALGAGYGWRLYHPPWEPWVVEQLSVRLPEDHPRPSNAEHPVPGRFGERLQPAMEKLRALDAEWAANPPDADTLCLAVALKPRRSLGPDCKRWWIKAEPVVPLLDDALAATSAGPALAHVPLRCTEPDDVPLRTAGLVAVLQMEMAFEENDERTAVDGCLRALELSRDSQWESYDGVAASHETAALAARSCLVLARVVSAPERERLSREAAKIAQGLPTAGFLVERAKQEFLAAGMAPLISQRGRRALPPEVQHCLALTPPDPKVTSLKERRSAQRWWPQVREFWTGIENGANHPDAGLARSIGNGAVVPSGWQEPHQAILTHWWQSQTLPHLLHAIQELARARTEYDRHGAWPTDLRADGGVLLYVTDAGELAVELDTVDATWSWADGGELKAGQAWSFTPPTRSTPADR